MKNNDFWSWKHIAPNDWTDLLFGIVIITACICIVIGMATILIDVI